jgi:acetoin utilization protein AcuA
VLGSIEVSEAYRERRLATQMLDAAFADGRYEDKVVVAEGVRWHWDLEGSGTTAMEYRRRLVALFARYGFEEASTDDADIRSDEANVLLVRFGGTVPPEHVRHFHALRYLSRRTWRGRGGRPDGR